MRIRKTQHIPSRVSVSQSGGAVRTGTSAVGSPKDEVGVAVGVIWFASNAPETGTIVGAKVGVSAVVGCVESGCANEIDSGKLITASLFITIARGQLNAVVTVRKLKSRMSVRIVFRINAPKEVCRQSVSHEKLPPSNLISIKKQLFDACFPCMYNLLSLPSWRLC